MGRKKIVSNDTQANYSTLQIKAIYVLIMHCYLEFVCGEKISQKLFDCEGIKTTEQQNKYAPSKRSIPSLDTEILVDHGSNKFLRRHTMISSPLYFFCSALCNTKEGEMFLFSILDLASQLIPCQSAILEDSRD